MIFESIYISNT